MEAILEKPEECVNKIFEVSGTKFDPDVASNLWPKILQHKWLLSEKLGRDVGLRVACIDFFENVEQAILVLAEELAEEAGTLAELVDVIRPGGLGPQKAPRIQATLARIREERGGYDLEFLAEMPALEARDWLTSIDGIGKKTASIVLAFCFGMPVMAVDRHVERVSKRIGLIPEKATADQAHDMFLELVEAEQMYAAHVLLIHHGRAICHAQSPAHDICPVADRCRMVSKKAP